MSGRNPESIVFGPALSDDTLRSGVSESKGPFRFVPGDGLWRDGQPVSLPPRAIGVLTALLATPGEVVTKQALMDAVWPGTFVTESSLLEAIGLLRDTLGDDRKQPIYIQTVHRRGYRFIATLERPALNDSPAAAPLPIPAQQSARAPFFWATAALALVSVAAAMVVIADNPLSRRTSRFSISLPSDATIDPMRGSVAVSLDGSRLVYVATASGRSQLFVRSVDRDTPVPIDGTEDASDPFFSPDGEWVGFFAHGSLQKVRVDGGTPIVLCAARAGAGATWTADNTIVFGGGPGGGLARVSAFANSVTIGAPADTHRSAGSPIVVATPADGSREVRLGWPDVLPGDRGVLYTSITLAGSDVGVIDLRTGKRTLIAADAAFARYSPSGHVVFERQGRLEAAGFSLATLNVTTTPAPIVSGLARGPMLEGPRYAFSKSGGLLVYVPAARDEQDAPLQWLDAAWRPGGREIAFAFSTTGPFNVFMKPVDAGAPAAPLSASRFNQFPTSWRPDGAELALTEFQPESGADIWILDVQTGARRPLVRTLFDETWARFSPDGQWIAYMSNESGRWEVYARPSSGDGSRVRVSTLGGAWPCWSTDGKTIYFSSNGRTLAAGVTTTPALAVAAPVNVAGAQAMVLAGGSTASDRLLVRQAGAPAAGRAELRVVLEWFSELTKRQS